MSDPNYLLKASEFDVWMRGFFAGYEDDTERAKEEAYLTIYLAALRWLRAHNDAVVATCPNLPDLERRYSVARTTDAKREALRALLAARDAVIAAKPAHDAVQAQAVMPLRLGMHPTGIGGDE